MPHAFHVLTLLIFTAYWPPAVTMAIDMSTYGVIQSLSGADRARAISKSSKDAAESTRRTKASADAHN